MAMKLVSENCHFWPWPIEGVSPRPPVAPGLIEVVVERRLVQFWFDPDVSADLVMLGSSELGTGFGPLYSVFTNDEGEAQFDGTLEREPFSFDTDILARYLIRSGTWLAGPHPGPYEEVTTALAVALTSAMTTTPERLDPGQVRVDDRGAEAPIVHLADERGIVRLLPLREETDPNTDDLLSRLYHVVGAPSAGDASDALWFEGGYLAVDSSGMYLTPSISRAPFTAPLTGQDIPAPIRELGPVLLPSR